MYQMLDELESLNPSLPIYNCNSCGQSARHPVLPPCCHLHCWKCVHYTRYCRSCHSTFELQELFTLFINSQQQQSEVAIPPKPRPKYSQRVRNSGGVNMSESTSMMRNQNNVQSGALFAGHGYIAPLAINTFSSFSDENQEDLGLKWPMRGTEIVLLVVVLLMLGLS